MADSPEENSKEVGTPMEDTTTEIYHDAETVIMGSGPSIDGSEKTEIHILVEITHRGSAEAATTATKHLQILHSLYESFDRSELDIYDNKGKRAVRKSIEKWKDITTYDDSYNIHQGIKKHCVIFRVLTTRKFGTLKRDSQVWETLNRTGSYMKRHYWPEDKWDVATLGFIIEIDPSRHIGEEVREYVIGRSKREGCFKESGCKFKLIPERFKLKHNGTLFTTYAFAVQCLRPDAKEVDTLLKSTFRDDGQNYVKMKLKKSLPKSYTNAMTMQNRYLAKVRTITIVGITRTMMKLLKPTLLMRPDVAYVAATTKTDTIGRWDVITLDLQQESLQATITDQLDEWISETPINHDPPASFPPVGIQSKSARKKDDESSVGDVSYLSSSAGSYDSVVEDYNDQASYQEPPSSGIISGMSWAQAASRQLKTPSSTAGSQPTVSNISELTSPTAALQTKKYEEMEKRLSDELSAIRSEMTEITEMRTLMMRLMARLEKKEDEESEKKERSPSRAQDPNGSQYQSHHPYMYPPFQRNGYSTQYHPHPASPGHNYDTAMYDGYPDGQITQTPQQYQWFQQRMEMSRRVGEAHMAPGGAGHGLTGRAPSSPDVVVRDLNKRSHSSPFFDDKHAAQIAKRKDQRTTPQKINHNNMETEPPPDPTGQSRIMTNPYDRPPGTPTAVQPPPPIPRQWEGRPHEWKVAQADYPSQPPSAPPEEEIQFDYGKPPYDTQPNNPSHPAADARIYRV
jgi:hypothetical protein